MNICLIPARSGSKRIKNKNIKNFFGKPIISYTIKTAINSKLFDKIFVSTDSEKIANISKKNGAEVPFIRPKSISNDHASDKDVIDHFLKYAFKNKININYLCYIYPINPLIKISTLKKCKNLLINSNCKKVMTVGEFSYPIQRALVEDSNKAIKFRETINKKKRSQELKTFFHDAGQCYWFNLKKDKKIKNITKAVILKQFEFLDVDTLEDFNNLKKIYKLNLHKS